MISRPLYQMIHSRSWHWQKPCSGNVCQVKTKKEQQLGGLVEPPQPTKTLRVISFCLNSLKHIPCVLQVDGGLGLFLIMRQSYKILISGSRWHGLETRYLWQILEFMPVSPIYLDLLGNQSNDVFGILLFSNSYSLSLATMGMASRSVHTVGQTSGFVMCLELTDWPYIKKFHKSLNILWQHTLKFSATLLR